MAELISTRKISVEGGGFWLKADDEKIAMAVKQHKRICLRFFKINSSWRAASRDYTSFPGFDREYEPQRTPQVRRGLIIPLWSSVSSVFHIDSDR